MINDANYQIIHDNGGVYSNTVTGKVTHLVCADPHKSTSKLDKARKSGIKVALVGVPTYHLQVVSEDELLAGLRRKDEALPENEDEEGEQEEDIEKKAPKPLHHMDEGDSVPIIGNLLAFVISSSGRKIGRRIRDKIERWDLLLYLHCLEDAEQVILSSFEFVGFYFLFVAA